MNRHEERPKRRNDKRGKGFSLVELLIVVAIILIIMAIAIPSLLRAKISANESSAVSSVRQINNAEVTYFSSWGSGYAALLTNLGGAPAVCAGGATAANACLLDDLLSVAPYTKSGYTFTAKGTIPTPEPGGGIVLNGFEITATPAAVQVTGVRAFCSDHPGVIRFVSPSPAAGIAPPCNGVPVVPGVSGPIGN